MSNMYCTDCTAYEDACDRGEDRDFCHYKHKELACIELEISRNVPPNAYGYCRGFIPIGTDAIKVIR